jgi:hypothetical protein
MRLDTFKIYDKNEGIKEEGLVVDASSHKYSLIFIRMKKN